MTYLTLFALIKCFKIQHFLKNSVYGGSIILSLNVLDINIDIDRKSKQKTIISVHKACCPLGFSLRNLGVQKTNSI